MRRDFPRGMDLSLRRRVQLKTLRGRRQREGGGLAEVESADGDSQSAAAPSGIWLVFPVVLASSR